MEKIRAVPERNVTDTARDLGPRYLRTAQAAEYLGIPASTLLRWRRERRGPVPIRTSASRAFYDRVILDQFMAEHATYDRNTSAAAARP